MTQTQICFDPPAQRHIPTSVLAAESLDADDLDAIRLRVFRFIANREKHGATDDEIYQQFPDLRENSLRPRRIDLVSVKWIKDSGETRLTRSGRPAVVWVEV